MVGAMQWFKRIFFFLAVNLLVMFTLSVVIRLTGVDRYFLQGGMDYTALAGFCLIWGMGGSLISLLISRMAAKWSMGVQVLDVNSMDPEARWLVGTVHRLARQAGIDVMPEVGIYESPELNAFATGPTKNRSLVAVSTGLLRGMGRDEVEGVLGHEVAHIANGDMVTMTLLQGVVNAFAMFLARAITFLLSQALRSRDDEDRPATGGILYFIVQMALEMVFMVLGSLVVAAFSRWREFRADAGSASLAGRGKMIRALQALERAHEIVDPETAKPAFQSLKISGRTGGFLALFSSHPPIQDRIERLSGQMVDSGIAMRVG
jgi:heat shock protein HtpX